MHGKIGRDKIQDWSGSDSFTLNNSDADIESDNNNASGTIHKKIELSKSYN